MNDKTDKRRIFSALEEKWLKENHLILTKKECSIKLNKSIKQIIDKIQHLKLLENRKNKNYVHKNRITINEEKIPIDNPQKAYSLGILWGDGYLYCDKMSQYKSMRIGMIKKDFNDIKLNFSSLGNWIFGERTRQKNRTPMSEARLLNSSLGLFFYNLGYKEKSVVSCQKVLDVIPENLIPYFWQGYSDADGSWYINNAYSSKQFCMAGSYKQDWTPMENLLKNLNIKYTIARKILKRPNLTDSHYSVLRITNLKDILTFGKYIYPKNIGLKRKYQKYQEMTKLIKNSK